MEKMNKKGDEMSEMIIILIGIIVVIFFGYFIIYNPIIKTVDGCWSWERKTDTKNFSLVDDYNFTCKNILDYISLELYYPIEDNEIKDYVSYTICKGKVINERVYYCLNDCFKNQYKERCLG